MTPQLYPVNDLNPEIVPEVIQRLRAKNVEILALRLDVTKFEDVVAFAEV